MAGSGYITLMDYDRELTTFQFRTGNIDPLTLDGTLTEIDALVTATDNITLGTIVEHSLRVYTQRVGNTPPSDQNAQRERKWLVYYEDSTEFLDVAETIENQGYKKIFTTEIGTADLSKLAANSDTVLLTQTQIAAWKTAFEAIAKSPYGGAITVLKIQAVGRNL